MSDWDDRETLISWPSTYSATTTNATTTTYIAYEYTYYEEREKFGEKEWKVVLDWHRKRSRPCFNK
jgi:hypothetical protein